MEKRNTLLGKLYIVLILILLMTSSLLASELSINAYVDQTRIGLDDVLRFTIEISGERASSVRQPELPEIEGFTFSGSSTSSSSSFSVVNGRMTSTVTRSYIYNLRPQSTGNFLIPPISIQHDGEILVTKPIRINVTEGTTQPPPVSRQFREPAQDSEQIADNIFIIPELSKTSAVRGEPIILNYRLYSRYDLANLSYVNEPNFTGFWKDDIFFANRMNMQRTNYDGRMFNVMTLRTIVLYPNQSGTLTIPTLEIATEIITRPRTFFDFSSTRRVSIASKPVSINIRELPATGRPAGFTGAVGDFRVRSEITSQDFTVGDTFTYTLHISGNGNFKHFEPPPFPVMSALRSIDPEVVTDSRPENNRVMGSETVRYPVVLQEDGNFTIPPIVFSFFNPAQNSYISLETSSFQISVAPSDMRFIPTTVAQQDVVMAGADISYIYRTANLGRPFILTRSFFYWFAMLLMSLTIPFAFIYRKERSRLAADINYVRKKQARKILHKYLHKATEAAKKGDNDFYSYVSTGLSNYLTDTLKIPRGSTTDTTLSEMQKQGYATESINRIKDIINRCLEARFMPGGFERAKIEEDYDSIKDIISLINRQNRSKRGGRK